MEKAALNHREHPKRQRRVRRQGSNAHATRFCVRSRSTAFESVETGAHGGTSSSSGPAFAVSASSSGPSPLVRSRCRFLSLAWSALATRAQAHDCRPSWSIEMTTPESATRAGSHERVGPMMLCFEVGAARSPGLDQGRALGLLRRRATDAGHGWRNESARPSGLTNGGGRWSWR